MNYFLSQSIQNLLSWPKGQEQVFGYNLIKQIFQNDDTAYVHNLNPTLFIGATMVYKIIYMLKQFEILSMKINF